MNSTPAVRRLRRDDAACVLAAFESDAGMVRQGTVRTLAEAEAYLQTAPGAVGAAKRLARRLGPRIDPDVIEISMDALVDAWDAPEAAEGIAAFFDRRKPGWQA